MTWVKENGWMNIQILFSRKKNWPWKFIDILPFSIFIPTSVNFHLHDHYLEFLGPRTFTTETHQLVLHLPLSRRNLMGSELYLELTLSSLCSGCSLSCLALTAALRWPYFFSLTFWLSRPRLPPFAPSVKSLWLLELRGETCKMEYCFVTEHERSKCLEFPLSRETCHFQVKSPESQSIRISLWIFMSENIASRWSLKKRH